MEDLDDGIETRCVIITGSEGMFSAGYDIGDIPDEVFAEEAERIVAHPFSRAIEAVERFPFPTLAAINGHALGGGLELAVTCDLRVAGAGFKLGMPPGKLGLIYSHTGIQKFLDTVGPARTRELFFTGRNVSAERAEQIGLVHETVPREADRRVRGRAGRRDRRQRPALPERKQADHQRALTFPRLSETLEREVVELRMSSFLTEDFREGVRAFGEKRKPRWQGR